MDIVEWLKSQTQQQPGQPSFFDRAASNPFLQTGIGILANNTGNYGAFAPALGRGVQTGLQNVNQFKQQQLDNQDRALSRALYGQQLQTAADRVKTQQQEEADAREEGRLWVASLGIDPDNMTGSIMPVSNESVRLKKSATIPDVSEYEAGPTTPVPPSSALTYQDFQPEPFVAPTPPIDQVLNELGYTEGQKKMFYAHAKAQPAKAQEKLQRQVDDFVKTKWKVQKEARTKPFEGLDTDTKTELWAAGITDPNDPRLTPEFRQSLIRKADASRSARAPKNLIEYPEDTIKFESGLRKEFDDTIEAKAFPKVQAAYDQISFAAKNPSAANDLALATKFMKLLDPESVVRESELAMAMQASGAWDRMVNYHNRLLKGEKLTPTQRQDFLTSAEGLYDAALNRFNQKAQGYRSLAKDYKMNPDRIAKPVMKQEKNVDELLKKYGGK